MDIRNRILINRGEVAVSSRAVLETNISTCVSVCLYHPEFRLGGMTHISRSREVDTTPSGKNLRTSGYYYADNAIPRVLHLFGQRYPAIRDKSLEMVVAGGLNNEGPVSETLAKLHEYEFKVVGLDVNKLVYRRVVFDTALGIVTVGRKEPFSKIKVEKRFKF
ncbi:MAG: chemotaxis protein CheD [Deltaproteobacteria bacterium]|nr:chemotaxis protein CheD [Deltaproteobacteria bacterium]